MAAKIQEKTDAWLRGLLAERKIRVTEQRLVILRELAALRSPTSHGELTERLAAEDLDRATVYRNLVSLANEGVLVKTQLGDAVWRFQLLRTGAPDHGAHPHFVCTDCGAIECLSTGAVKLGKELMGNTVSEVQVKGQCESCTDVP